LTQVVSVFKLDNTHVAIKPALRTVDITPQRKPPVAATRPRVAQADTPKLKQAPASAKASEGEWEQF
jgi:methyl-accepting chemotaxis protein